LETPRKDKLYLRISFAFITRALLLVWLRRHPDIRKATITAVLGFRWISRRQESFANSHIIHIQVHIVMPDAPAGTGGNRGKWDKDDKAKKQLVRDGDH
jgi:hypothetical protein